MILMLLASTMADSENLTLPIIIGLVGGVMALIGVKNESKKHNRVSDFTDSRPKYLP